jgi:peptide/nickel transport system substrate-binding protein
VTGEYDFVETVEPDQYDTLRNNPDLVPLIVKPYYWYSPHFNKKQGLFTDKRLRQAVALVINRQEAMTAGFGRQEFIRLDPSVSAPETVWHSDVGKDRYLKTDVEAAKALLQEAGYAGQTVRWLATKEYTYNYPMAEYTKQKMEAIGMKVELVVSDWATLVQNRAKPEAYEIFLTGHSGYSHPSTQPFNDKGWPGFWDNAAKDKLLSDMVAESDPAKQKKIIDDYENLIYDEVPFVKCGDNFLLRAHRKAVKGYVNPADWFFWNVSLG